MESPANPRRRRISARTKLAFSSGSLEQAMVGAAGVATMIYYNQVLGVSPALCGTAFLIASIVDAVSDPLVGALSDSVRTRWGRRPRHPVYQVRRAVVTLKNVNNKVAIRVQAGCLWSVIRRGNIHFHRRLSGPS